MRSPDFQPIHVTEIGTVKVIPAPNTLNVAELSVRRRGEGVVIGGRTVFQQSGGTVGFSGEKHEMPELVSETMRVLTNTEPSVRSLEPQVHTNGLHQARVPFIEKDGEIVLFVAIATSDPRIDTTGQGAVLKAMTDGHIAYMEQTKEEVNS